MSSQRPKHTIVLPVMSWQDPQGRNGGKHENGLNQPDTPPTLPHPTLPGITECNPKLCLRHLGSPNLKNSMRTMVTPGGLKEKCWREVPRFKRKAGAFMGCLQLQEEPQNSKERESEGRHTAGGPQNYRAGTVAHGWWVGRPWTVNNPSLAQSLHTTSCTFFKMAQDEGIKSCPLCVLNAVGLHKWGVGMKSLCWPDPLLGLLLGVRPF